mmetsp:Transcript_88661/g.255782  ORF Transcript_88661/g.255782 Transcript_88661/m.255782 type:complete len:139 (+) Transcript_88661:65-481(+)
MMTCGILDTTQKTSGHTAFGKVQHRISRHFQVVQIQHQFAFAVAGQWGEFETYTCATSVQETSLLGVVYRCYLFFQWNLRLHLLSSPQFRALKMIVGLNRQSMCNSQWREQLWDSVGCCVWDLRQFSFIVLGFLPQCM